MLIKYNEFSEIFSAEGFEITEEQYSNFSEYSRLLVEWNAKINLTAITDPREIAVKHFLDSVLPLKMLDIPQNASVIDIGTGAGFPGLPMKILRPDIKLTLLDSLNKRVNFLKEVCATFGIDAVCIHNRAEDGARKRELREQFDVVSARAVAAMPILAEYCLPYVKIGGVFAALKGPNENIGDSEDMIKALGGEISDVFDYSLPGGGGDRMLICIRKVFPTSEKYPERSLNRKSKKRKGFT